MSHEEMRGKVKQVTGRVKEAAGILAGDKKLEQKGSKERVEGAVQEGVAKASRKVHEMAEAIKD